MDSNISDFDVQQNIHLLLFVTDPGRKAPYTTHSSGHWYSDRQQHCPYAALDIPVQSHRKDMEQANSRSLLHRRTVTKDHHVSGAYFHHLRLRPGAIPNPSPVESPDPIAYQGRLVHAHGSWSHVRLILFTFTLYQFTDATRPTSTAACCIVRTIMNWQNVNSDPTWASIDNWYWRSWEVCIGIIAASIPTLRPAYRAVSVGISTYFSRRSLRQNSDFALVDPNNARQTSVDPKSEAQQITRPQASYTPGFGAAAQAVSAEADRAEKVGVGVEGFPMQSLPGDKKTADQGIKKTTRIEIGGKSESRSQRSLELGDVERGFRNREFL